MSRLEQARHKMGGTEFFNQKTIKRIQEKQRLFSGDRASKENKAQQRKVRQEEFIEKTLPEMQLERALGHMSDGRATPEEVGYILKHADKLGPTAVALTGDDID